METRAPVDKDIVVADGERREKFAEITRFCLELVVFDLTAM